MTTFQKLLLLLLATANVSLWVIGYMVYEFVFWMYVG
jgi:hypothetical protein